jgi:hypothetical protein
MGMRNFMLRRAEVRVKGTYELIFFAFVTV